MTPPNEWNDLHEALSVFDAKYDGKRLDAKRIGKQMKIIEGRMIGNKRLIRDGTYQGAAYWKIQKL